MNIYETALVGKSDCKITRLGLGTGPLGYLFEPVSDEVAVATIAKAYELGIRWFDTSPLYGQGLAELRLGRALRAFRREDITIGTKVGYVIPCAGDILPPEELKRDYSYDGVLRSLEGSLNRLGCGRLDIVQIHDPDNHFDEAMSGAYPALRRLRDEGVVRAIGVGINQWQLLVRFADAGDFDSFLCAGRYTLLDQSAAAELLPLAKVRGISIMAGGVFNSGILANPSADHPMFNYAPSDNRLVEYTRGLEVWCREEGVPIQAAAVQFPMTHAAVAGVLVGARSPQEVEENVNMARYPIPSGFWDRLEAYCRGQP